MSSLLYLFIAFFMQKKKGGGEGVQIACKDAYVINGRPLMYVLEFLSFFTTCRPTYKLYHKENKLTCIPVSELFILFESVSRTLDRKQPWCRFC